jgi:uncharacterized Zn finger protein
VSPCKHIAAVYYLLAERFDADPFLIFTWRGRTPDELLAGLRMRRARAGKTKRSAASASRTAATDCEETRSFWQSGSELAQLRISPLAAEAPDALARRLGPVFVDADARDLAASLAAMYTELAAAAERRALSG